MVDSVGVVDDVPVVDSAVVVVDSIAVVVWGTVVSVTRTSSSVTGTSTKAVDGISVVMSFDLALVLAEVDRNN